MRTVIPRYKVHARGHYHLFSFTQERSSENVYAGRQIRLFDLVPVYIKSAIDQLHCIARLADDTLDVIYFFVFWRFKDNDFPTLGITEFIDDFIGEDIFAVVEIR